MNTNKDWLDIASAPKDQLVMVYTPPQPSDWPDTVRIGFDYIDSEIGDDYWYNHGEHYEHYCCVAKPENCTGPQERAPYTHWMPLPAAPCLTCGGHGMVGGLTQHSGYDAEPCPDCSPASTVADEGAKDERRRFEAWAGNKGWPLSPYQNNCGIVVAERYGHRTVQKAWEAWQERASTGAPAAGDALSDPALQKLFGDVITGALGFGAQGVNPPPAGHWLEPFWKMARADAALANAQTILDHPLLREVLGYIEDAGPADVWGAAHAWMALRDAAISASQQGGE